LDPTTRRVKLDGGQEILLTDTVGFVQRLPTTLVAAFRATLEEVTEADLLVHVVDASHPHVQHQVEAVEQVLEEIGAGGLPMVVALNKCDLLPSNVRPKLEGIAATLPTVSVSAADSINIDALLNCISEALVQQFVELDVLIPYDRGDLVAQFHHFGTIDSEDYEARGTRIHGHMPTNHSGPYSAFNAAVGRHRAHA
jgi:GTP-binding protein HflX